MQGAADTEAGDILRSTVASTLRRLGGTTFARALQRREVDAQARAGSLMAESGWTGVLVPEQFGGSALGVRAAATIAEELGRVALPAPFIARCVLPAVLLARSDSAEAHAACIAGLASGTLKVVLAHDEATHALERAEMKTTLSGRKNGLVLRGRKTLVAGADSADCFIVAARKGNDTALCLVPADAAGVTCRFEYAVDGTCFGAVEFSDAKVSDVLAVGAHADRLLARAREYALTAASAELYGVMSQALEMTLGYMRTRVQFGRPIGAFQALQHRAAELFVQKALAYSVVQEAIALIESGADSRDELNADSRDGWGADSRDGANAGSREIALAVRRAKARCSDAALRTTKDAVQLHGAIGYTDEYDISLYLKRAMVLASWLGNGVVQRREYVRLAHVLGGEAA